MKLQYWLSILLLLTISCSTTIERDELNSSTIETIEEMMRQHSIAVNSGDLDGFMTLLSENVVLMPPNEPAIIGKKAVHIYMRNVFANYTFNWNETLEDIKISNDLIYVRTSFDDSWSSISGDESGKEQGKNIYIYQKLDDGKWKIISDVWNTNASDN